MIVLYRYQAKKKRLVHELDANGKTWCKLDHSTAIKKLGPPTSVFPDGRKPCTICEAMKQKHNGVAGPSLPLSKKDFYTSWEWAKLRYEVLKRYGAVCMCCRSTENIVVDHIKPRSKYPELELSFDNMQVLCSLCNRGKGAHDETDWRVGPGEALLDAMDRECQQIS